jgi:hypothetical protein
MWCSSATNRGELDRDRPVRQYGGQPRRPRDSNSASRNSSNAKWFWESVIQDRSAVSQLYARIPVTTVGGEEVDEAEPARSPAAAAAIIAGTGMPVDDGECGRGFRVVVRVLGVGHVALDPL